jgi:hypothetical protein
MASSFTDFGLYYLLYIDVMFCCKRSASLGFIYPNEKG